MPLQSRVRAFVRALMGVSFIIAGVLHFTHTAFYLKIMPPYLPAHLELIYLSGVLEILGGIGVFLARTRRWAGYGLAVLLVAVLPANLHMALNQIQVTDTPTPPLLLWLRLPLQAILILLIIWCTREGNHQQRPTPK
ncbi:MAG: DoxX family protein [Pyrinomonadaceae bacterium]|nr:DoxX family protein [Pyrinomonadaceae bacterium]